MAQVSMNLTDFEQTPIHRVFELVKREAARYGVAPVSSEIVGLIPKLAIEHAAEWFLQVEKFDSSLILENRLASVMSSNNSQATLRAGVEPFIEALAAPTAAPGGGSAAAAAAAMAAGLAGMVAGILRGKKAYALHEALYSEAIDRLAQLREQLKAAIDADADAYKAVTQAYKLPKDSPNRSRALAAALQGASAVPLGVAEKAAEVAQIAARLKPVTNPAMFSDLITGIALADAARTSALANVETNLDSFKAESPEDGAFVRETSKRVAALKAQA